jgi:hypothetical protein
MCRCNRTLAAGVIVDNADATGVSISGSWTSSTAIAGYWGTDYLTDGNTNKGGSSVSFTPVLPSNGVYQVALRWTDNANRATNVPVDIIHPAGTNRVLVNQQSNGGAWVLLLTTNFNAGTSAKVIVRNTGTTGYVIADAVQFLPLGLDANPPQPARLRLPSYQAHSWQLNFLGTPGTAYRVQRAATLSGSWTDLGRVSTAPDGSAQWIDAAPPSTGAFYRVIFP